MLPTPIRFLLTIVALYFPLTSAAIEKSGRIAAAETWTREDGTVVVSGLLTVNRGVTLTIKPGVEVRFEPGAGLIVEGRLVAQGTVIDSILFTSNGDLKPGVWGGIYFHGVWEEPADIGAEGKFAGETSLMDYCIVEYAGNEQVEVGSAIEVSAAGPIITHSVIHDCLGRSGTFRCGNISAPVIENCTFLRNHAERGGAVSAGVGSQPVLRGNQFVFNRADDHGGAIYTSLAAIQIIGNTFLGNEAGGHGGALYTAVAPELVLRQNVFIGNRSLSGSHVLYFTKRVASEVKDNLFDSQDSTCIDIYLNQAELDVDASGNWWGFPDLFSFKDAVRDKRASAAEPYVYYEPYLIAPPEIQPANPKRVDEIILCRHDDYSEEIPRGVAEGAILRIRLKGEDTDPYYPDIIQVKVISASDQQGVAIPLRETAPNSGVYVGRGRVERYSDPEKYTIGSREGSDVTLFTAFAPDLRKVYPTMSPKPLAENLSVALSGNENLQHLTNHTPPFTWGYFDVLEVPQRSFQVQVFPVRNGQPAEQPVWDSGETRKADHEIAYSGQPLEDGESYVVKMKVANDRFWSDEITLDFRMNSLPTAPQILQPLADQLAPTPRPPFAAATSTDREGDPLKYHFEILNFAGDQLVGEAPNVNPQDGQVAWTPVEDLVENAGYRLRVAASDPLETGPASDDRIFYINAREEPAAPFSLSSPAIGDTIYPLHPTLVWEAAVDPDPLSSVTYQLEIARTPDFTGARVYDGLLATEFAVPDSLDNVTTYYWRVTAIDNTGLRTVSGAVGRFFIDTTPSIPAPAAPLAGEERMPADELTWEPASDPNPEDIITYEIEVYTGADLTVKIAQAAGIAALAQTVNTLVGFDALADNQVYHWRVRSRDNHNAASAFSRAGSFFFNKFNDPPSAVAAFTAPADTVMGTANIRFAWIAASDPDLSDPPGTLSYELECTLTEFTEGAVRTFRSEPGVAELVAPLDDNRLWHYRIRTHDNEDATSPWSAPDKVLVNVAEDPPASFALLTPADGEQVVELDSLLFTWQASSDPDWESSIHYRLEILPRNWNQIIFETKEVSFMYRGGLANEGEYTWRVVAIDNTGLETVCSAGLHFHTSTTPTAPALAPMPPELMPRDALAWGEALDPNPRDRLTYTVEVGSDSLFGNVLVHLEGLPHQTGTMTRVIETLPGQEKLEDDVDYYLRVLATDNHNYNGLFSEPVRFRFNRHNDPPGAPASPFDPAMDAVVRDQKPVLGWGAASDEDLSDPPEKLAYDLRLDSDGELEKNASSQYSTSAGVTSFPIPTPLKDNTPWVWQVRTRDDDGAVSEWSSTIPFLVNVAEDPPSAPALKSPRNGQKLNILGPVEFVWAPSTDPDWQATISYRLEYSTSPEMADAEKADNLTHTSFTVEGPLQNTTYYWRIIATDNTGLATSSEMDSIILDTRPSVPVAAALAEIFELTPEGKLAWSLSVDPNPTDEIHYELQVGVDFGASGAGIKAATNVGANTATIGMQDVLGDNQVFNWRVRAVDNHDIASDWSKPAKFFYNMKNDPPNPVGGLLEPANETEVSSAVLTWKPASDVDFSDTPDLLAYDVELSPDPEFAGNIRKVATKPGVTTASISELTDDTRWYWRVRAVDDDGAQGAFSPVRSFIYNTSNDPPNQVTEIIAPADGADVRSIKLTWGAASDPDIDDPANRLSYRVELSQLEGFGGGIVNVTTKPGETWASPTGLEDNVRWFWRVRAVDEHGAVGLVSEVRSFDYHSGNNPPGSFSLTAPANNAQGLKGKITLKWTAAVDPDAGDRVLYSLSVATDAGFTTGAHSFANLSALEFTLPEDVTRSGGTFYWKVSAQDGRGGMTWGSASGSAPWTFSVRK
jgi:hypothetical protein